MDAKARLRLYLEQRRELGESELVLDRMSVDDVLAMLGAAHKGPRESAAPPTTASSSASTNTRDRVSPPRSEPQQDAAGSSNSAPHVPTPDAATPPVYVPPPAPPTRFDPTVGADWRETLRQAGASSTGATSPSGPPLKAPAPAARETAVGASSHATSESGASVSPSSGAVLPAWLAALGFEAGLSVRAAGASPATDGQSAAAALEQVAAHIASCTACALGKSAKHAVPGEGDPLAELLCVGEAPGANEDEQGKPFVGEAGQLLTKILGAIQMPRESVYICNVLKHRPPANRDPLPEEVLACQPFLQRQLSIVAPRVIIALGRFAAQTLLNTTLPLGKLRGQIHLYNDVPVIVTYHPAALLRNEAWKRPTWEDVQRARRVLDASRDAVPRTRTVN